MLTAASLGYVAECLVECALAMQGGGVDSSQPDWQQIVHADLKPDNIFLAEFRDRYPFYPSPLLADFGIAFRTSFRPEEGDDQSQSDPNNPSWVSY